MSDKSKIPCKRCLIRDLGEKEALECIQAFKDRVVSEHQTDNAEYEQRLAICKDCKWLHIGVCQKSGYYVEAKAYVKEQHCPLGNRLW